MKAILYCELPYSYEILYPLYKTGLQRGYEQLWYIPQTIQSQLDPDPEITISISMQELSDFRADVILVPTNSIPHYLRGLKVQVFHGLAGEKKGHFRIRHYFDLYLTQGPYFTKKFNKLAKKYKDFSVVETGWSKLDSFFNVREIQKIKETYFPELKDYKDTVIYAPTFSPSLTSAKDLLPELQKLTKDEDLFLFIKFHDKMNRDMMNSYRKSFAGKKNVKIYDQKNISSLLIVSDYIISDTSSIVYEFVLLNKPALSYRSRSKNIKWLNIYNAADLITAFRKIREQDEFEIKRKETISEYHPYTDGRSSERMWNAIEDYINLHGVPEKRNLSFYRKQKVYSLHGKIDK